MGSRPKVQAPAPVDNSALEALQASIDKQEAAIPARALPPAVMQASPWVSGGGGRSAAGRGGANSTILTAPGGLVPATDAQNRGKSLLGS